MRAHYFHTNTENAETTFSVRGSTIKFGPGCLSELGEEAQDLALKRIGLFADPNVMATEPGEKALKSLQEAGLDVVVYDDISIEPTDVSLRAAADFAADGDFDGYVSLGGGSVMDTAKAANLLATYPDELLAYVNAPVGQAKPVPGPLKPHIACPTTAGTGSETTGVAVVDFKERQIKTGISSKYLRPTLAVVDPETTYSLAPGIIACTGFDILTHAIESFTAIPYNQRQKAASPGLRPPFQGANPFSDIGSLEAIWIGGNYLPRAVNDPSDTEARIQLMFAATLAGQSFGNAGVHIPHAMSYSVAGLNKTYTAKDYEKNDPMVPHGLSVVLGAPAAFKFTAPASHERHMEASMALGADLSDTDPSDSGKLLADTIVNLMKHTHLPSGLREIGYSDNDVPALVKGAWKQQRLLAQSPREISEEDLTRIYQNAMSYW